MAGKKEAAKPWEQITEGLAKILEHLETPEVGPDQTATALQQLHGRVDELGQQVGRVLETLRPETPPAPNPEDELEDEPEEDDEPPAPPAPAQEPQEEPASTGPRLFGFRVPRIFG